MVDGKEIVELQQIEETKDFKLANVIELFENGTAKIRFYGEETASEKEYSYLASYKPSINDIILVTSCMDTYIILGKVLHNITIEGENVTIEELTEKLDLYALKTDIADIITSNLSDYVKTSTLSTYYKNGDSIVVKNVNASGDINHTGSSVKFFNGSLVNKTSVSTLATTATLAEAITKINQIVNAGKWYNLF